MSHVLVTFLGSGILLLLNFTFLNFKILSEEYIITLQKKIRSTPLNVQLFFNIQIFNDDSVFLYISVFLNVSVFINISEFIIFKYILGVLIRLVKRLITFKG